MTEKIIKLQKEYYLNHIDSLKEIFTSNYDLIIEKSLEAIRIPHFDGFVGSYEPFFWQEEQMIRYAIVFFLFALLFTF